MKKLFIIYGAVICLIFFYASYVGWTISDSVKSGKWGPQGRNVYHK